MTWEEAVQSLLDDPDRQQLVRDCYFDQPALNAAMRYHASSEWASVRSKIRRRGGRALDVGAGNGIVSYAAARDGWPVTAIEPDSSDLVGCGAIRSLANAANLPIQVFNGVAGDLQDSHGTFDVVFARQVFHHATDIRQFAAQLFDLLAPRGLLLTWRDHVVSGEGQLPAFFDQHPLHKVYGGENAFREDEYRDALKSAGFVVLKQWRQFDDSMNYGPATPAELFQRAASRLAPDLVAKLVGATFGSKPVFGCLAPFMSAFDRRPGRLVAFLALKNP